MKKLIIWSLVMTAVFAAEAKAYRAGLAGGYINKYSSTESTIVGFAVPDLDEVFLGPAAATNRDTACKSNASYPPIWGKDRIWSYHGEMYFDGSVYGFGESIEDMAYFAIDGARLVFNNQNNYPTWRTIRQSTGWHSVLFRLGNSSSDNTGGYTASGSADKNGLNTGFGFGINMGTPAGMHQLAYPADPGDGTLFRYPLPCLTLIHYTVIAKTASGYRVSLTQLSAIPLDITVSLGTSAGEKLVTSAAQRISAGGSGVFDLAWSSAEIPYIMTSARGNDGQADYWEETEPMSVNYDITQSVLSLSAPASVIESDVRPQSLVFTRHEHDASQAITVSLSYTGNRADFTTLPDSFTMAVGETTKTITFTPVDNELTDGDRNFIVTIAAGSGYTVEGASSVTISVIDDESTSGSGEWTGAGDGKTWADPENWSFHRVPTVLDTVLFGGYVTGPLNVTVDGATGAKLMRITTDQAISLTGSFYPFDVEMVEGSVKLNLQNATLTFNKAVTFTIPASAEIALKTCRGTGDLTKYGAGKMTFVDGSGGTRYGAFNILAGTVEYNLHANYFLGTRVVIGGGSESASLVWTYNGQYCRDAFNGGTIIVKNNGTLDLSRSDYTISEMRSLTSVLVETGGIFRAGGCLKVLDTTDSATNAWMIFEGTVVSKPASRLSFGRPGIIIPSTRTSAFVWEGQLFGNNMSRIKTSDLVGPDKICELVIEDIPGVAVDAVFSGWIPSTGSSYYNGYFDKQGEGVMRFSSVTNNYRGPTRVSQGTMLADNASGSATGKGGVRVVNVGVLGGVGTVGGLAGATNPTLFVGSTSATGYAVIHPGTIDDVTGKHVVGTLTAGSAVQSCATTFDNRSALRISAGHSGTDQLQVYGKVTITGEDNLVDIVADDGDPRPIRTGVYRILTATEGIEGAFAGVRAPTKCWAVVPVLGTGEQASVVVALDLVIKNGLTVFIH